MGLAAILIALLVGLAVGVVSGVIGIGGGVLMVPFLYFVYAHPQWFGVRVAPEVATVVAHATSLFAIAPTSIRGAIAYHRAGLVVWRAVWPIGVASAGAAVLGSQLALLLSPALLKVLFGVLLIVSAIRLLRSRRTSASADEPPPLRLSLPITVSIGLAVGLFSALLGVGGGVVAIPLLLSVVGLDVRRVAATSIGIIAITAVAGTVSYVVSGLGQPGLPSGSIGYVHVAAGLALAAGAVTSIGWGTGLNQRLPARTLALLFAALFLLLGLRLVVSNAAGLLAVG